MKRKSLRLRLIYAMFAVAMFGCNKSSLNELASNRPLDLSQAALVNNAVGADYINDNYIVVMKDDVSDVDTEVDDISRNYNVKAKFRYKHTIKGFAGALPAAAVEALRHNPKVAYIEQDQEVHLVATESNPPSWGLDRIDQQSLPLSSSYTYNTDGTGVDAYIIDCGILLSHTDFGGRAVTGIDEITPGGTATDGNGHGTHVAGTVGGSAYGVAKNVKLIAVRVLDNSGSGSTSGVIAGIDWVTGNHTTHPAVANMSLGGGVSTTLDDAVRRSIADGVTYCIAAGNSTADASTSSPARVTEAVTVGATDVNDGFAYFSNYGSIVDISAPGVNITSDWNTSTTATNTISGTSMATPHVTGVAALYLAANPTATPDAVQNAIKSSGTSGKITSLPSGTPNLLLYSLIGTTPPPSSSPAPAPAAPTLSSPANGSSYVSRTPTYTWNASGSATKYSVQVATDAGFSAIYDQAGNIGTTSTRLTKTLGSRVTYYWRVNATNSSGTSAWSTSWSFRTTK
jgi:subtilisin family serine protease